MGTFICTAYSDYAQIRNIAITRILSKIGIWCLYVLYQTEYCVYMITWHIPFIPSGVGEVWLKLPKTREEDYMEVGLPVDGEN